MTDGGKLALCVIAFFIALYFILSSVSGCASRDIPPDEVNWIVRNVK